MKYVFTQTYSLNELSEEKTYRNNEQLTRLCKRVIAPSLEMSVSEAKRRLLKGELPTTVKRYTDELNGNYKKFMASFSTTKALVPESLSLKGIEICATGAYILLSPNEFDRTLHKKIRQMEGSWDEDRSLWTIPLKKVRRVNLLLRTYQEHALDKSS